MCVSTGAKDKTLRGDMKHFSQTLTNELSYAASIESDYGGGGSNRGASGSENSSLRIRAGGAGVVKVGLGTARDGTGLGAGHLRPLAALSWLTEPSSFGDKIEMEIANIALDGILCL